MNAEPSASTDTSALLRKVDSLQAELECLRRRYDALLVAKNRAAARYKADYKKWRDFKRWLFEDIKKDDELRRTVKQEDDGAYKEASTLGKRKQFEMIGPDVDDLGEDLRVPSGSKPRRGDSHPELASRQGTLSVSENKLPPLVAVVEPRGTRPNQSTDSDPQPKSGPSRTPEPKPHGGTCVRRGRYAQVPSAGLPTINSRFAIRRVCNHGVDFQFDAVVRDQDERRHMQGGDCECCRDYYKGVGPLPGPQGPLWRSPTRKSNVHSHDKENADHIEQHKQRISRHRHHWHRAKTPPAYWEIGFPDTQEASEINRRAAEMHKRKLIEIETEARHPNSRYLGRTAGTPP